MYQATTKSLIDGVISGYNATVFAYGPTGEEGAKTAGPDGMPHSSRLRNKPPLPLSENYSGPN